MSSVGKQVRNGKAFEYAIAMQYYIFLDNKGYKVRIIDDDVFAIAKKYFEGFTAQEQDKFNRAAHNTIDTMVKIEPGLTAQKDDKDILSISLQPDQKGKDGDVRDVLFKREKSNWEIGFSAKNNNDAAKHSRLGRDLDFGDAWLGVPCSVDYWNKIKCPFDYLEDCKKNRCTWNDLGKNKRDKVYVPLLNAFKDELLNINSNYLNIPEKLVEYLIGNYPFYKIIKDDSHNLVIVKAFNIKGGLNKPYNKIKSAYSTPKINLPNRIVEFKFKEGRGSDSTLIMILDGGWVISFRLHNAKGVVENSLKFDIRLLGNPSVLFTQHIFQ